MNKNICFVATAQWNVSKKNLSTIESGTHCTSVNTTYCQPANLVPHFWNYKIVDKEGSPDLPCIMILSEIFGWFRNLSESQIYYSTGRALPELVDGQLAISYDYLAEKLNFQKERIRRKLVKLEELGILARDIRNISLEDGSRINQLYLSIDQEFFKTCFRNPELDIRVRDSELASIDSTVFEETPPFGGEHIRKKNKIRSMNLSNSFENNLESKNIEVKAEHKHKEGHFENLKERSRVVEEVTFANNKVLQQSKQRQLEDFYPLSAEDCSALQSTSGREFSLNAMNEILKNMSKRITNRFFYSKKGFLSYMSHAFRYEKRDAVKINNTDFRIRANLDSSEQTLQIQEKYLTELEYSLQVSPEWHFKKKLASVLERDKAYKLLTAYKGLEIEQGKNCKLILTKHIELTANDKEIILNQIKATHQQVEGAGTYNTIEDLVIAMPRKSIEKPRQQQSTKENPSENRKSLGIWGEVRSALVKSLGDQGEAIDNHWLSKLNANIDKQNNKIELKAPSEFVKSYIEERLWLSISEIARSSGFELKQIEC
ncbi:MAG: hypothetical protein NWS20_01955 [Rickettsiaceae bacterium]|nr:hypothetical protein [Rickettsiaceae bacterium]